MNKFKIITIIFLIIFSSTQNIFAGWCQGKQLSEQKDFWIFETGLRYRLSGSNVRTYKGTGLGSVEIGYMRNLSQNLSRGASLYLSGDDDGSLFAVRYRQRHWLAKDVSLEFSPGIILNGSDNYIKVKAPSFLASVSLNLHDLFSIDLQYQALRYDLKNNYNNLIIDNSSGTQSSLYGGMRFGSYAGLVSAGVALVVGIIAVNTIQVDIGY